MDKLKKRCQEKKNVLCVIFIIYFTVETESILESNVHQTKM